MGVCQAFTDYLSMEYTQKVDNQLFKDFPTTLHSLGKVGPVLPEIYAFNHRYAWPSQFFSKKN